MLNTEYLNNLSEISAEMLVNYLYPELKDKWIVQTMGAFYRNYNHDVLSLNAETGEIQLSRDSFANMLPQGLLYHTDGLNDREASDHLNERRRLLEDLFRPLDTLFFLQRLNIEREVSSLLDNKLTYILSEYYTIDLSAETNPYVRDVAMLLPFISHLRGDLLLVRNILASLFKCEVNFSRGKYSHTDNTSQWVPMVKYELIMPELTQEQYYQLSAQLQPLIDFIKEWFVPFEAECFIAIKWHEAAPDAPTGQLLNYNTHLKR